MNMLIVVLAIVVTVLALVANTYAAHFALTAGFMPTNVGYAYGLFGAWFTTPAVAAVWWWAGASVSFLVIAATTVLIVPYFGAQAGAVQRWMKLPPRT